MLLELTPTQSADYTLFYSGDLLVFSGGIPEDLATHPSITLAQAREPETLELTSPIVSPTPDNCSSVQETDIDSAILRDKDVYKLLGKQTTTLLFTNGDLNRFS